MLHGCKIENNCLIGMSATILDNAVIELKIIDENPTDEIKNKEEKLNKLAELFGRETKTVILEPNDNNSYEYYKILATPFKSNLKKASKQLQESSKRVNKKNKIAIIMNQGLTMTSQDEFKKIAIERAKNDTSGIDILIVCGIYYFSDKFDMSVFTNFEDFHIRGEECKETVDKLRTSWNKKINKYMTQQIVDINLKRTKEPIKDLFFELNGIRYVKPPISWGKPSSFYRENGRPREDSSEDKECKSTNKFLNIPLINFRNMDNNELKEKFEKILFNPIEYRGEIKHTTLIFVEVQEIGMDKANDIAFISYVKYDEESNTTKGERYIYGERIKFECALLLATYYCIELKAEAVYFIKNEDFKWQ
jgi:hypothetical protein